MKKIAIFIALLAFPLLSHAQAQLFWLADNTGYDLTGNLQAFCLNDGNCYDVKGMWLSGPTSTSTPTTLNPANNSIPLTPVTGTLSGGSSQSNQPIINQPTMQTDDSLEPFNLRSNSYDKPVSVILPSDSSGKWNGHIIFQWDLGKSGQPINGEVVFQGETVLTKNGNAISFTSDGETFDVNSRKFVDLSGPFEPNTTYSFTYNQDGRTVTRSFQYVPGQGMIVP